MANLHGSQLTVLDEKPSAENVEYPSGPLHDVSAEEIRQVIRKLDWHVMPLCFILYTFSVLDRSNLGNAKLAGMTEDIDLSGNNYTWLGTS